LPMAWIPELPRKLQAMLLLLPLQKLVFQQK
jgi:hypothetical protein